MINIHFDKTSAWIAIHYAIIIYLAIQFLLNMNKTELLEKIKNGEDSFTQFKLNITRSESLAN